MKAIGAVQKIAEDRHGGIPLNGEALRTLPKGPWAAGWGYRVEVVGELKDMVVVIDTAFPWSAPHVYLHRPPPLGTFPHLEKDGLVCVAPSRTPADPSDPGGIVDHYLRKAVELTTRWADPVWTGQEIAAEYLSYIGRKASIRPVRALHPPDAFVDPHVVVWRGARQTLLARRKVEIVNWLRNAGLTDDKRLRFDRGVVVRLSELIPPSDMPKSARDLLTLADAYGAGAELAAGLLADKRPTLVTLVLPTRPHSVMAAYDIPAPPEPVRTCNRPVRPDHAGFRPGRVPPHIALARRAGADVRVVPEPVERLDPEWIHGRDANADVELLQEKRAVILGCGSLGSGVAIALAKAGIGGLDLIDPECLDSENAARHELGLSAVGNRKASGTATMIARRFPHIRHCRGHDRRWQWVGAHAEAVFDAADLFVVTIGDWAAEGAFETWRVSRTPRPNAVYGWLEPHAVAAHAVMVGPEGSCFGCGLDRFGQSLLPVADWLGTPTTRSHPACGGTFQPYGATALARAHGVVADACLDLLLGRNAGGHRIWAAPKRIVDRLDGHWSDAWDTFTGGGSDAGGEFERPWRVGKQCIICDA